MKEERKAKYYQYYHCPNCSKTFSQEFEFGEVAHQGQCPHCGVNPDQMKFTHKL